MLIFQGVYDAWKWFGGMLDAQFLGGFHWTPMTDPWDERYIYLYICLICMVDVSKYTGPMDPMVTIQHFWWFSVFIEPLTRQWAAIHGSGKKPLINIFPLKYPGFKNLRKPIVSSMSVYVLSPLFLVSLVWWLHILRMTMKLVFQDQGFPARNHWSSSRTW